MKKLATILLSISLIVGVLVFGSVQLTSNALAQPPEPMSNEADFLGQSLSIDDVQGTLDPQFHFHPRLFHGTGPDFETALHNAIAEAQTSDWGIEDGDEFQGISFRVIRVKGSAPFGDAAAEIRVTILAALEAHHE